MARLTMKVGGLGVVLAALCLLGCGDDGATRDAGPGFDGGPDFDAGPGSDAGPETREIRISVPVDRWVTDISFTAGEPRQDVFVTLVPTELGTIVSATIDVDATLARTTITRTDGGASMETPTLQLSFRVAAGENRDTVCSSGIDQGSTLVTGDSDFNPVSAEPSTLVGSDETLAAFNTGTVTVCIESLSSVDAVLSIEALVMDIALRIDCTEAPADIAGTWSGSYSCVASPAGMCADEGGPIELTIWQAGLTAAYTDSEAFYLGTVCGNVFRYTGGGPGYEEHGVFTLTGSNTATKESEYMDFEGICSGSCMDDLTRM